MKLSDIIVIKKSIDKLPHAIASWALTVTTILCVFGFYIGIKVIARDFKRDKEYDRAVTRKLLANDSIQTQVLNDILIITNLQDLKLKAISEHINKIEKGNGILLKEIRQLDTMRQLLTPFQLYISAPVPEKKNSLTQQLNK